MKSKLPITTHTQFIWAQKNTSICDAQIEHKLGQKRRIAKDKNEIRYFHFHFSVYVSTTKQCILCPDNLCEQLYTYHK